MASRTTLWRKKNPEKYRQYIEKNIDRKRAAGKRDYYKHHAKRRATTRARRLVVMYGLTAAEYDALLLEQCGVCAICGQPETIRAKGGRVWSLHVDHDHATGKTRGLLCHQCNTGLGYFVDNPSNTAAATKYLNKWRKYGSR